MLVCAFVVTVPIPTTTVNDLDRPTKINRKQVLSAFMVILICMTVSKTSIICVYGHFDMYDGLS